MQFSASALLVLASAAAGLAADCLTCNKANNGCQRLVAGTNGAVPQSVRLAACSAALAVTVTPEPVITTVTEVRPDPTVMPTYISTASCANAGEWASACRCGGVTASTITAAVQTVTVTTTVAQSTCATTTVALARMRVVRK